MGKYDKNKDDTNYFSNLKYGRDEGVAQDVYVDTSDAYANYKQYVISFLHVPSNSTVFFKAYVTEYNETFNCSWNPTEVYGRTDPIQSYRGTKRSVSLSFDVPAASVGEAYENLGRISRLVQMLYPTYAQNEIGNGQIIGQAPLVRVKMMNFLTKERRAGAYSDYSFEQTGWGNEYDDLSPAQRLAEYKTAPDPENGVLAAIGNITYRSDLSKIQMFEKAANTVLPQSLSVSLSFDVIHEETVGWDPSGNPLDSSFPHKIELSSAPGLQKIGNDQNPADISTRVAQERENQAIEDMKAAQKNRFLERLGINALGRGLSAIGDSAGVMGPTTIPEEDY